MTRTIFYSWQSDLNPKHNRNFISDAIERAIKESNKDEEYIVYHDFDRDTRGTTGSPDIVDTIFSKIKTSEIFICDISIINKGSKKRKTPNPNVLIELGYAASELGWDNIICLFNEVYGKPKDLPFDIQTRRIMPYYFDEGCDKPNVREELQKKIVRAIQSINDDDLLHRRKVERAYQDESHRAQKLALAKPDNWGLILTEELLRSRMENILVRLEQIDDGTIYIPRVKMNDSDMFKYCSELHKNAMSLMSSVTAIMTNGWLKSVGHDYPKDEIRLVNSIRLLEERLHSMLKWEMDIKALIPPKEIEEDVQKISIALRPVIRQFMEFLDRVHEVYTTKPKNAQIITNIKLDPEYDDTMVKILGYFQRLANNGQLTV